MARANESTPLPPQGTATARRSNGRDVRAARPDTQAHAHTTTTTAAAAAAAAAASTHSGTRNAGASAGPSEECIVNGGAAAVCSSDVRKRGARVGNSEQPWQHGEGTPAQQRARE